MTDTAAALDGRTRAARELKAQTVPQAPDAEESNVIVLTADELNRKVAQAVGEARRADELRAIDDRAKAEAAAERERQEIEARTRGGYVTVRTLTLGDRKISDGSYGPSNDSYGHYRKGDIFRCPRDTAEAYEAKGWAEITEAN